MSRNGKKAVQTGQDFPASVSKALSSKVWPGASYLSRLRGSDESRFSVRPLAKRRLDAVDMSVGEHDGPADRREFYGNYDWQLAVARRDRRVGNPRCNKPDHGRNLDRQKRVRGIQMRDKNADGEFLDEILPSCSRTLHKYVNFRRAVWILIISMSRQLAECSQPIGCGVKGPHRGGKLSGLIPVW